MVIASFKKFENLISKYEKTRFFSGAREKFKWSYHCCLNKSDIQFIASTHSYLLLFTNKGKVHWLKVHKIPQASRQSKGTPIVNLIQLEQDEKVNAFIPVKDFIDNDNQFLIMATKKGTIKKTELSAYSNPRKGGIIAITLDGDDQLIEVLKTTGQDEIFLATKNGKAARFSETNVRPTGRSAKGVRGMKLKEDDDIIGMVIPKKESSILKICHSFSRLLCC